MDNITPHAGPAAGERRALLQAILTAMDAQSALDRKLAEIRAELPEYTALLEARSEVIRLRAIYDDAVAASAARGADSANVSPGGSPA